MLRKTAVVPMSKADGNSIARFNGAISPVISFLLFPLARVPSNSGQPSPPVPLLRSQFLK
jgi:hypothetical protein